MKMYFASRYSALILCFFFPFVSLFFQCGTNAKIHNFLVPMFESIGLKQEDQYPQYNYRSLTSGTCFTQSVFAGRFRSDVSKFFMNLVNVTVENLRLKIKIK